MQKYEWIAYPEDEIQHEDHVFHARTDVREIVTPPAAMIIHYVLAKTR